VSFHGRRMRFNPIQDSFMVSKEEIVGLKETFPFLLANGALLLGNSQYPIMS